MYKLARKTQIILVTIGVIIIGICYYLYTKEEYVITEENNEENNIEANKITEEENIKTEEVKSKIIVHVSGAVKQEGVYELKENSRVADAIEKAGGLREDAYIDNLNLAYKIEDGTKIHILTKAEYNEKIKVSQESNNNLTNENGIYVQKFNEESKNKDDFENNKEEKVNINKATQTELETLPGIGPSTAMKIIEYRKENGEFKTKEDLKNVSGIGEVKFKNIQDKIVI